VTDPTHPFSDSRSPHASPPSAPQAPVEPPAGPGQPSALPSLLDPRTRPGRPSLLTVETADRIVGAIEQGSYLKIAAQAVGVGQSTLAGWLARGREAGAVRDAHDPEHRYCPECDTDREDEVAATEQEVRDADEQHEADLAAHRTAVEQLVDPNGPQPAPPVHPGYPVLDRCPTCRSDSYPLLWTLPEEHAPYLEFLESVTRAQAVAEVDAVGAWRRAFTGHEPDWRAARDWLARTAPERWAGVTRVQMTTEEAERRIDDAVNEALLAVGIDLPGVDDGDPDAALDEGLLP